MTIKRVLGWLVAAFVIYAIYKTPGQAADAANRIWDIIQNAFTSLTRFFNGLSD